MTHGTGDSYETPDILYNALDKIYNFKLDAFASAENAKCEKYYTEEDSALDQDWDEPGNIWMNPPYSRGKIYPSMRKAYEESLKNEGRSIVGLVRDDFSTMWYGEFVEDKAAYILRLKHRLKFKGAKGGYDFPCCVVIYNVELFRLHRGTITTGWWYE